MTVNILDLGGSIIALNLINQDAYASEFFKRVGTRAYSLKVRHTQEKAKPGQIVYERHNVDLTVTTYSTDGSPPKLHQQYFVLRAPMGDTEVTDRRFFYANLPLFLTSANDTKLFGWETDVIGGTG